MQGAPISDDHDDLAGNRKNTATVPKQQQQPPRMPLTRMSTGSSGKAGPTGMYVTKMAARSSGKEGPTRIVEPLLMSPTLMGSLSSGKAGPTEMVQTFMAAHSSGKEGNNRAFELRMPSTDPRLSEEEHTRNNSILAQIWSGAFPKQSPPPPKH